METFEKYEIWDDCWCFKPTSELNFYDLEVLNYRSWFRNERDKVKVHLETDKDSIEPTNRQVETLNYILKKQNIIKHSIFEYYQNVVLPIYKVTIGINENDIVDNIGKLHKVFGLRNIEIPEFQYPEIFYYLLQFDFRYDDEHGLYLLFRDDKIIDLFGEGDKNYDAISLFQNGLKNSNNERIKVGLYKLNGDTVFNGDYFYDEEIIFELKKGTYRAFIVCNQTERIRNFYVQNDLKKFTLKKILTME